MEKYSLNVISIRYMEIQFIFSPLMLIVCEPLFFPHDVRFFNIFFFAGILYPQKKLEKKKRCNVTLNQITTNVSIYLWWVAKDLMTFLVHLFSRPFYKWFKMYISIRSETLTWYHAVFIEIKQNVVYNVK